MDGSNRAIHDLSIHHRDAAAEIAALKAKLEELQKQLAAIDAILAADEQVRGRDRGEST